VRRPRSGAGGPAGIAASSLQPALAALRALRPRPTADCAYAWLAGGCGGAAHRTSLARYDVLWVGVLACRVPPSGSMMASPSSSVGVVPQRTGDPAQARQLFCEDGAVILTGAGTSFFDAAAVPEMVFGPGGVRSYLPPIKICFGNGAVDGAALRRDGGAHTDGYAYGDCANDGIVLLCERPCGDGGGENFLIDPAQALRVAGGEHEALGAALRRCVINQTSTCRCTECVPDGEPLVSQSPVWRSVATAAAGPFGGRDRDFFRLFRDQRPVGFGGSGGGGAAGAMIREYHELMQASASSAPRFTTRRGDALLIDNWRLLHGRDSYSDPRRSLWRVWFWTADNHRSSIDAAPPGSGSAVMPPLPPNDWRLSHLDGDAEATASRHLAGYDPLAIATAIPSPPEQQRL
jgi:hypothetical protein